MHPGLQYLSMFPPPQGQGSAALSTAAPNEEAQKLLGARPRRVLPGTGATHLRCGLTFSTISGDVLVMFAISCPAHDA